MISKSVEGVKLAGARLRSHIYIYRLENTMTTLVANTFGWLGFAGLANWFKKLAVKLQARRLANITVKELSALSDRELNDMGLHRGDIHYIAEKHYEEMVNKNLKGWV